MQFSTRQKLLALNRRFYEDQGESFAHSRYQLQPGVRSLLPQMLKSERILDLGCGNGNLAHGLAQAGFLGHYLGLDQSQALLDKACSLALGSAYTIGFLDLAAWLNPQAVQTAFENETWPLLTCFATLHHLPSRELHQVFFRKIQQLLEPGGFFLLSVWQPMRSERLRARVQNWATLGFDPSEMEAGDMLLDWRAETRGETALRYVHEFDAETLEALGKAAGLRLQNAFRSDGKGSDLAYYQVWQA